MTEQKPENISSIPIDGFSNLRITSIWTFLMSVQWSEPWLIGLIVFHVVCLFLTVVTCRFYRAQICHFLVIVIIVMVWVYRTFSTMTELKTLQLKRRARREKREKND